MSKKTNSNPASEEKAQTASAAEQTEETAQQTEAEAAKQSEDKKPEEAKQQEASEFEKAQQALAQAVEICCGFVSFYLALPLLELVLSLLQTMIGG